MSQVSPPPDGLQPGSMQAAKKKRPKILRDKIRMIGSIGSKRKRLLMDSGRTTVDAMLWWLTGLFYSL